MKNRTELYELSKKHFNSNIGLAIKYSMQCLEDGTLWFRTIVTWWQDSFKAIADKGNTDVTNFIERHSIPVDLAIDKRGNTMLHFYADKQNTHLCSYLIGRGAKLAMNAEGEVPKVTKGKDTVEDVLVKWVDKCGKGRFDRRIWGIIEGFHGGNLKMLER